MRYGESLLQEILQRTDLVQLIGRRVKLARKGHVFWGLCPFHNEKSPSFKVENERRTYHCFGCGAGGDAFKWLQETEGFSFPEAVKTLADQAGVALPAYSPEEEAREMKRTSLYDTVEHAAEFFEAQLRTRTATHARDYLKSRGLNEENCKRFRIGFAPDSNDALIQHLLAQGVSLEDMITAGLARPADEKREARDFFFARVIFPISDVQGRIVAFGGRALSPDAKPKYINSGETPLFAKGRLLYNLRGARGAITKGADLIVAEGYMDVIALALAGFEGAVAPLGTALTEDQLALLWRIAPEPILCFDGDEAGTRAANRAAHLALPLLQPGRSLRFAFLPPGEDPDSLLRSQGAIAMNGVVERTQGLAEMLWRSETHGRDFSTPERRAGLEAVLDALVKTVRDAKVAEYYRRDFEERVFAAFKRGGGTGRAQKQKTGTRRGPRPSWGRDRPQGPGPAPAAVSTAVKRSLHAVNATGAARVYKEKEVMALALACPILIEREAETLARLSLSDPQLDRLKHELLNLAASRSPLEWSMVDNHLHRQGFGPLVAGLRAHRIVVGSAVEGSDTQNEFEAAWHRALGQLQDPDRPAHGELAAKRDAALQRYLDGGTAGDWEELQRLNNLIRTSAGAVE